MNRKRRSARHAPSDAGISLVEVSVAIVIMGVVFAALGTFLITAMSQQRVNELKAQAVQLGNESIENGRALPWELAGFYADDAQAASCGTTDGPVVSIDVPADPAMRSSRVPTAGSSSVTVNGTQYTRTICYRWLDDDNDGTGAADTNGTEDVKRIEVSLAWQDKGATKTHVVQGLRAPTAAEVAPRSATGLPTFGILSVTPDPATANAATIGMTGGLTAPLSFTATTSTGVSTVQLRWTDADGSPQVRTLSVGATTTSWSITLPAGTGPFAPVSTAFTFSAYASTGEVSTQNTTVSFSQNPGTLSITSITGSPDSIDIDSAGFTAVPFTVTALTNEDAGAGTLRFNDRSGSPVSVSMVAESARKFTYTFPAGGGPFAEGSATFSASISGAGGTATSGTTLTFVPPTVVAVTLVSNVVSPSLCVNNSDGRLARGSVIDTVVEGVGSSDEVKLLLGDSANTPVSAAYVGPSGSGALFRFSLTTASTLSWKSKSALSLSVTATRKADNTQATKLYTSTVTHLNGSNSCPIS